MVQNLNVYMSQNGADLVDFMFHSQRMLSISIISMSQNLVDLVDFVFHSQRRPKNLYICMSQRWLTVVYNSRFLEQEDEMRGYRAISLFDLSL